MILTAALRPSPHGHGIPPAAAQGRVHCGTITHNETWGQLDSPHQVTCDVVVRSSVLTLEAGATVLMGEGASLIIQEGSTLSAVGNQNSGIRIQGNARDETPGFWGQVRVARGATPGALDWVTIQGGGKGNLPMAEFHEPMVMDHMRFQKAQAQPLAFRPEALGPSLEAIGALAGNQPCERAQFIANGANAIGLLPGDEPDVATNQRWFNFCVPYQADETLTVAGPDLPALELNQNLHLQFGPDAGLVVGVDADHKGSLQINGTVGDPNVAGSGPVVLTAANGRSGGWKGVELTAFSTDNTFFNAVFEFGGGGGRPMMTVESAESTASLGTRFRASAGYPLAVRAAAVGNFLTGLAADTDPIFEDNLVQRVLVLADAAVDLPRSAEWAGLGVPYEIQGDLLVAGKTGVAKLTLSGGAELMFDGTERLVVGDEQLGQGSLLAAGLVTRPIVFTAAARQPGAWGGIVLGKATQEVNLDGVVVEYGGAGGAPMVDFGEVRTGQVTRTVFRHGVGYPAAIALPAIDVLVGEALSAPGAQNKFESNGTDRVLVHANVAYTARQGIWSDPGAPVEFDGTVTVARPGNAILKLIPGLTLLFRPGSTLQLGLNGTSRATLTVDSDGGDPVTLGAVDDAAGWGGVRILPASAVQTHGTLDQPALQIAGLGGDGVALRVDGGVVEASGLALVGSGKSGGGGMGMNADMSVGLDMTGAGARASISQTHVTGYRIGVRTREKAALHLTYSVVTGNREWGVLNEDPTLCQLVHLVYWGSPQGPNDPSKAKDGCLNGGNLSPAADKVSDDVDWWPYAVDPETFAEAPFSTHPNPIRVYLPRSER